jgi:exodeoxyribonuclease-5
VDGPIVQTVTAELVGLGDEANVESGALIAVQGGRERGLVIHKLLEEVLTGETPDSPAALNERAATLIHALGKSTVEDPMTGLSPVEIAGCVVRTLQLPQIAALRPTLLPEFPVYSSKTINGTEQATAGIADAMSVAPDGSAQIVIDWKSDVDPKPETVEHYRAQVASYLRTTGATNGLIVFVTTGAVVQVEATG